MYVYYSLGNLISLQDHTPQMLGGIADVTLYRDPYGNVTVTQAKMDFTVTHYCYDPSILLYYNICTYRWEDYTPELAAEHGMSCFDSSWSYGALQALTERFSVIEGE